MTPLPPTPNLIPSGTIDLQSANDEWGNLYTNAGAPFAPTTASLAELTFKPGVTAKFQAPGSLAMDLGTGFSAAGACTLQLYWPDQVRAADNPIDRFGVGDELDETLPDGLGYLYLVASLSGNAKASLTGKVPQGALSASFGVEAGGELSFTQLIRFKATDSARSILDAVFTNGGLRLPQTVGQSKTPPAHGEIIALSFGGYVSLSSKISWGYSMSRRRSFAIDDLAGSLTYSLKLAASAALDYKIAGEFSIGPALATALVGRESSSGVTPTTRSTSPPISGWMRPTRSPASPTNLSKMCCRLPLGSTPNRSRKSSKRHSPSPTPRRCAPRSAKWPMPGSPNSSSRSQGRSSATRPSKRW